MSHSRPTTAFVFADRSNPELEPLVENTCTAMLPVANKPALQYTLEDLARNDVRKVTVFISRNADAIETFFGDGTRLGLELDYQLTRGEEDPVQLLWRLGPLPSRFVALRGDVLRSPAVSVLLDEAGRSTAESLHLRLPVA